MGGYSERKADIHAAAETFDGSVEKIVALCESGDLIEFAANFAPTHPKDSAVEEDVLAAGKLGMKPSADFQQTRNAPAQPNTTRGRFRNPGQYLQQRALTGAVSS